MNKYKVKPKRKTCGDNRVHKTVNNSSVSNEKEVRKQHDQRYIYISKKTARKYLDPENKEDVILKLDRKHTYVFSKIAIHESRCADTRHKTYIFAEAKNEECPWAKTFFGIDYDAKGRPYLMIEDSEIVYNLILDYDFKQVEKDETWYCLSNEDAIKKAKMEERFYLHVKDENGKIRDAFCHGVVYGGDDKLEMILPHDYYLITYLTYDGTEFDEEDERNMQVYILEDDNGKVYNSYYKTYSYLCKDLKIRNEVLEVFKKPDLSNPIVAKIYDPDDLSSFTLSLDGLPEIRYISLGSVSYENNYYALLRPIEQTDIFSGDTVICQMKRNRIILLSDEKIAAAVCEEYQKLLEEDKRKSA